MEKYSNLVCHYATTPLTNYLIGDRIWFVKQFKKRVKILTEAS